MKVKEIFCKSLLNESRLPGVKYAVNPYLGCGHGCAYCYATFMCKYGGHVNEKWGEFVDAKINARSVLAKELKKAKRGSVLFSSVTDPYQPLEKKFELTRKCLELLAKADFPVSILTKNALALRDKDLFKKFSDFDIGYTITFFNDEDRKHFEPDSSSIEERFNALNELKGFSTYAFFGPIIPFISDKNLEELIKKFRQSGVEFIYADRLNIKSGNWKNIEPILKKHYLEKFEEIKAAIFGKTDYYANLAKELRRLGKENGLNLKILF